jgi:site-specific recombinase XerD
MPRRAPLIGAFLDDLERARGNSARTRNARLAAIHSFFRFVALREPAHQAVIQRVLAIQSKRYEKRLVDFLTRDEMEALLAAPNRGTRLGRRDHALLHLALQTGLRVSELVGLCCEDAILGVGPHVRCLGKGRKERCTPLRRDAVADPTRVASRARRTTRRAALSQRARGLDEPRRRRVPAHEVRRRGPKAMSLDEEKEGLATRAAA